MTAPRARTALLPLGVAACILVASAARADDLTLATRELGSWSDALAALRGDTASEGRTIHIAVRARGSVVACGGYRLELDEAARAAFRPAGCDAATSDTALVLARRAALFDESFDVPRPRTLSIKAVLEVTARGGGGPEGGSAVRCSVAVQPYLEDRLHGTRVMLTPEHYTLRPGSASVSVSPSLDGWSLSTTERATFRIRYEVVQRTTGESVLRQDLTVGCGPETRAEPPAPPPAPPPPSPSKPEARALEPVRGPIEVEWFGTWYHATVLEALRDGRLRIHYSGYSSSYDEYVPRKRVRPEK